MPNLSIYLLDKATGTVLRAACVLNVFTFASVGVERTFACTHAISVDHQQIDCTLVVGQREPAHVRSENDIVKRVQRMFVRQRLGSGDADQQ